MMMAGMKSDPFGNWKRCIHRKRDDKHFRHWLSSMPVLYRPSMGFIAYHLLQYCVLIASCSPQVGPKTMPGNLQCLCTHLSVFGGDLFVAPNPIDFDKVWSEFSRLGETGNFVVLGTVCSIFGLYLLALIFGRRADKKDKQKVTH